MTCSALSMLASRRSSFQALLAKLSESLDHRSTTQVANRCRPTSIRAARGVWTYRVRSKMSRLCGFSVPRVVRTVFVPNGGRRKDRVGDAVEAGNIDAIELAAHDVQLRASAGLHSASLTEEVIDFALAKLILRARVLTGNPLEFRRRHESLPVASFRTVRAIALECRRPPNTGSRRVGTLSRWRQIDRRSKPDGTAVAASFVTLFHARLVSPLTI